MLVRLGQRTGSRRQRRLTRPAAAVAVVLAVATFGCAKPDDARPLDIGIELQPPAPVTGNETHATIRVRDRGGKAIRGATLTLDAQMNHPGMAPVTVTLHETSDGVYEAPLNFTMAGDWVLVASGHLPDGRRVSHTLTLDVKSVLPGDALSGHTVR